MDECELKKKWILFQLIIKYHPLLTDEDSLISQKYNFHKDPLGPRKGGSGVTSLCQCLCNSPFHSESKLMDPLEVKVKQKTVICMIVWPTLEHGIQQCLVAFFHSRPARKTTKLIKEISYLHMNKDSHHLIYHLYSTVVTW